MTFATAINAQLIADVTSFTGCSEAQARTIIRDAKTTAKSLGMDLASTLVTLGFVSGK